ncbi:hypothetical protein [Dyadobacter endophyticus]|uniref:hypothetical protein n=1 Tax=Dyadobacter endophyticus TaxID=1749036 RepID=UPI00166C0AC5|nr:hypothetical protein [Dyadobacter endophyticus]
MLEKRSSSILNLLVKTILYLIISLLLIMCYIERQKSKEPVPAGRTASNGGINKGIGPDKARPAQQKMPTTVHQFNFNTLQIWISKF